MKQAWKGLGGLFVLTLALSLVSCDALNTLASGPTKASNANLADLDVSPGTLVPAFSANVTSYTVSGLSGTDSQILVNGTLADSKATVSGLGSYPLSASNANKYKVTVTAEDGTVKVYNIQATLPATASVVLSSITVNGTPIAGFDPKNSTYQVTVASDVTAVTLAAVAADGTANVTGTGNKTLAIGANTFVIVVSKGLQSASYTVVVNRPAPAAGGADVSLSSLKVNGALVTLAPNTFNFAVTVPDTTFTATVVATATAAAAVVTNPAVQALEYGENILPVLVTNGTTVVAYTVTITRSAPTAEVSTLVQEGLDAMKLQDYALAKTKFASALAVNPNDNTAKLWASLLDLASIQTDPALVDLYKTRLGVTGYPSDLNTYMAGTWFNENYYATKTGFVPAASDWQTANYSTYVRGTFTPGTGVGSQSYWYYDPSNGYNTDISGYGTFTLNPAGSQYVYAYSTSTYPASVPRYYRNYNLTDLTSFTALPALNKPAMFQQSDASGLQASEYPLILMTNILTNNPTGFNGLLDTVVSKMDFGTVEARLNSLSDTDRVVIPAELIAYSSATGPEISLSRNELRLLVASLKVMKGYALYLQSENLDLPLSAFNSSWGKLTFASQTRVDANGNGMDDKNDAFYANAPGFRSSTFLTSRVDGNASRAASKAEFIGAVEQIQSAASGLKAAWLDPNSYYHGWLVFNPNDTQYQEEIDTVTSRLGDVVAAAGTLLTAMNNGTSIYVNASNPGVNDVLGSWLALPTAVDTDPSSLVRVVPNALWDNNFLDPRNWLQKKPDGTFATYLDIGSYSWGSGNSPTFLNPELPASGVSVTAADFAIPANVHEAWASAAAWVDPTLLSQLLPSTDFGTGFALPLPGDDYQVMTNSVFIPGAVPAAQYQKTNWLNR